MGADLNLKKFDKRDLLTILAISNLMRLGHAKVVFNNNMLTVIARSPRLYLLKHNPCRQHLQSLLILTQQTLYTSILLFTFNINISYSYYKLAMAPSFI